MPINTIRKQHMSFEVFPPKKDEDFLQTYEVLDQLAALHPDFISVTYGAGGSKSKRTVEIASYIQNTLNVTAYAHLTCVGNKKEEILAVCEELKKNNITNILSLRGDRPKDMTDEVFEGRDFKHASEMISFLKDKTDFQFAAACYPEKHYEAASLDADLDAVYAKQEAGASSLITQLFFDNNMFYTFVEKARNRGITIPIYAGIMPITTAKQLGTTVSLSGSSVPKALADIIATYGDVPTDMKKAGLDYAANQIKDLQTHNVDGIHIYTMNKASTAQYLMEQCYK